ncbi:MAG: M67 family metallopeptidase [Acidimicrobiales bacterium]|nr:M67 family metallopeptidase [Acidimicrobiales bacterium]
MLRLAASAYAEMIGHAYDGLPDEACGLLGGGGDRVQVFVPARNADASSRTFTIDKDGWDAADEVVGPRGLEVVGVMHSHTHTDAYPSPTDVEKGGNPLLEHWHWIIVSLRDTAPVLRSFRIVDGEIHEEPVVVDRG